MHRHGNLIEKLGGGTALAVALWGDAGGKRRDAIYKWKQNGIPWRWRPEIHRLATMRGVAVPNEFLSGNDEASSGMPCQKALGRSPKTLGSRARD
jgi:hypothetical protein